MKPFYVEVLEILAQKFLSQIFYKLLVEIELYFRLK